MIDSSSFNVVDFGAVGDGRVLNTVAIQKAVDACAAAGGGKVVVPAGVFVSGPVFLKSNIEFHLSAGAVLQGIRDFDAYPKLDIESHGHSLSWNASLLTGIHLNNVSITGKGVIDGQGEFWWKAVDAGQHPPRPVLLLLCDCERVLLDGVKFLNSASWTVVPILCRNMTINNIVIKNPWKPYHNCDGLDLVSCRNVRVSNCHVDTGDDGICLKTLPLPWGKPDYSKPHIPCEDIVISNCVVEHGHCGVGIWAEVIGGMRNIAVSNCVFDGTRTGIRISRFFAWPGGFVREVRVDNILMRRVECVFEISNYWDPEKTESGPGKEDTPVFSNIHFSNITATKASIACEMYGMAKNPVRGISFSNLNIEAGFGFNLRNAEDIFFDNVTVETRGVPLIAQDVRGLEMRRFTAPVCSPDLPVLQFECVREAWIHGCTAAAGTGVFLGLIGKENTVQLEGNRLTNAAQVQANIKPANAWNICCSHAYSGSRWIRDSGEQNVWLPLPEAVSCFVHNRWSKKWVDNIWSISRFEANSRAGAECDTPNERRRIYLIEAHGVLERLIVFEDGELLRAMENPNLHAHFDQEVADDWEWERRRPHAKAVRKSAKK